MVLRLPQALTRRAGVGFCLEQVVPLGAGRCHRGLEGLVLALLLALGRGQLAGQALPLGDQVGVPATGRDLVAIELLDAGLGQSEGHLRAAAVLEGPIARSSCLAGHVGRHVPLAAQGGHACLEGLECGPRFVAGALARPSRIEGGQLGGSLGGLVGGRGRLGPGPLQERLLPSQLARRVLRCGRGGAIGLVGHAAGPPSRVQSFARTAHGGLAGGSSLGGPGGTGVGGLQLRGCPLGSSHHLVANRTTLEGRDTRRGMHHAHVVEDDAVTGDEPPAGRQQLTQAERVVERGDPQHTGQQTCSMGVGIEAEGGREQSTADLADALLQQQRGSVTGATAAITTVAQDHHRGGVGQRARVVGVDHQAGQHLAQCGLDGQTQVGLDLEAVAEPATTAGACRTQHRLVGSGLELGVERLATSVEPFELGTGAAERLVRGGGHGFGLAGSHAGSLGRGLRAFLLGMGLAPSLGRRGGARCAAGGGLGGGRDLPQLAGQPAIGLGHPTSGTFGVAGQPLTSGPGAGGALLVGAAGGAQLLGVADRFGQALLGLLESILGAAIGLGQDGRHASAGLLGPGRGSGTLLGDALTFADESSRLTRRAGLGQLDALDRDASLVEPPAQLLLGIGPLRQRTGQRCGLLLGVAQGAERRISIASRGGQCLGVAARFDLGRGQAGAGPGHERLGQLGAGRHAGLLLLGLGRQAASLGPQLGEHVADALEVGLRLRQLALGLLAATLVLADAGRLLEQRPTLLGPQREGLVDHALADEEEGVVGDVGVVEQLDQVAQADALTVEQVLVLTRAEQPAGELDLLEVDREQAVLVVDDQADVGHAHRAAVGRAREDEVLGAPAAQGPSLLPERPAQGVGEVGLAAAVGPDHGRDARSELDGRALGERLEADHAQLAQPGQAHGLTASAASLTEALERSFGRVRLGLSPAAAFAAADDHAVDRDLDHEVAIVIGAVAADDAVRGGVAGGREGVLLEAALGCLERIDGQRRLELRCGRVEDETASRFEPLVEVDGGHHRFEETRQHRAATAFAGVLGTLAEDERVADPEAAGDTGEAARGDDGGSPGGEGPLGLVTVALEERLGHHQRQDRIPQELESFVGLGRFPRGARSHSCYGRVLRSEARGRRNAARDARPGRRRSLASTPVGLTG